MSDRTVCVSLGAFTRAHGWGVYRVRTVSSTYHVAIGRTNGKGLAILRGYSVGAARLVDVQDSDPRLGTQSLFDVAPSDWAGKPLAFGTTTTSAVVEAMPETDTAIVTVVTSALVPASQSSFASPRSERAAYPEDWIEHAETAAAILRHVYQRKGLLEDIQRRPAMLERLNVALAECALMLRAIAGKLEPNCSR